MKAWLARLLVLAVFAVNVYCACRFILYPERYLAAYELSGTSGIAAVQGFGIVFLMWNATYPPVIYDPTKHRPLFAVVIAQQLIGLIGESLILVTLPEGHQSLANAITRFIIFDAAGLLLLAIGFILTSKRKQRQKST